ncbi:hypothetical protein SeLEV6574_g01662 [Synchytrium endobioticum]|uniref:Folic acid synthesis protein FOL1 n=1 Tax=Synchytrium endobioticum TaxID=286115 RepID=A0A507DBK5_9FUNG|nr:hypothetical protein SeLEV6574_g01662 [Synchytrium endobioticum]
MTKTDTIFIKDLEVRNIIGVDSWERSKRQPLRISLHIYSDIKDAGSHDSLSSSINYGTVCKLVQEYSEKTSYRSVEALAGLIAKLVITECRAERIKVRVEKPRALLHAACAGVELVRTKEDVDAMDTAARNTGNHYSVGSGLDVVGEDRIFVNDLTVSTIIGINAWEREERQRVVMTLTVHLQFQPNSILADKVPQVHDYRAISRAVLNHVEASKYKTVEALATAVAKLCVQECHVPKITVRVEKPSALVFAAASGVEITRDREDFGLNPDGSTPIVANIQTTTSDEIQVMARPEPAIPRSKELIHEVYIALGTNLGHRLDNLTKALHLLNEHSSIQVVDTSFLYETEPMYVIEQPRFLNMACKVLTSLAPLPLLAVLKQTEDKLGRTPTVRNGPRLIDLDLIYYDTMELNTEELIIPHPRIQERGFVLNPLCDIAPHMHHPTLYRTNTQLLSLLSHAAPQEPMHRVLPLPHLTPLKSRTLIMGILNVTPDSFSDGGIDSSALATLERAQSMIADGADIIDIGGMSTRPDSDAIPIADEIARVVPVITLIRARNPHVAISIDTYRAPVARAALAAGATMINDVSGGTLDPCMLECAASAQVPYILMHMRGTPKTMAGLTRYDDVVRCVKADLEAYVARCLRHGIRRWNIIVDPGVGFAKDCDGNFDLLRRLGEFGNGNSASSYGIGGGANGLVNFPLLVGVSRKGFIGEVTGVKNPKLRGYGTAAAVSACIAGGCDIIRVHDIKEMKDAAAVADRVWRIPARNKQ